MLTSILVGCGHAGTHLHHGAFRRHGTTYVDVCDVDSELARATADNLEIPNSYSSLQEALSHHNVDFMDIATPPKTHCDLAVEVMEAGCNVFIEKPMTETAQEAQRLRSVQKETNSKAIVPHNHKFMARISRNGKSQVRDIDPPDVLIDRDVVQHHPDPFDFLMKLTSIPSEATFIRPRTRDQGKTILAPHQSFQYTYGTWIPFFILNVDETIQIPA